MSNIIAVVWDFDKTLIGSYMQEPIFNKFGVDGSAFWKEVNALPEKYKKILFFAHRHKKAFDKVFFRAKIHLIGKVFPCA